MVGFIILQGSSSRAIASDVVVKGGNLFFAECLIWPPAQGSDSTANWWIDIFDFKMFMIRPKWTETYHRIAYASPYSLRTSTSCRRDTGLRSTTWSASVSTRTLRTWSTGRPRRKSSSSGRSFRTNCRLTSHPMRLSSRRTEMLWWCSGRAFSRAVTICVQCSEWLTFESSQCQFCELCFIEVFLYVIQLTHNI